MKNVITFSTIDSVVRRKQKTGEGVVHVNSLGSNVKEHKSDWNKDPLLVSNRKEEKKFFPPE